MTISELYEYKMTTEENEIWNKLKCRIIDDCKTMLISKEFDEWIDKKANAIDPYNTL